jgi:SAM-dependent methyltransferase
MSQAYLQGKEKLFREMVAAIDFGSALDLGANDGYFSKILAEKKARVIAVDDQWTCVGTLYRAAAAGPDGDIYPLCVDITDPTPASGFAHAERSSFSERAQCDLVVALAVVHHLVLTRNIPFGLLADYLALLARQWLIIEFVPLSDEKASALVRDKPGFHKPYDAAGFEEQFGSLFAIERKEVIPGTERVLYLMRKKAEAQ